MGSSSIAFVCSSLVYPFFKDALPQIRSHFVDTNRHKLNFETPEVVGSQLSHTIDVRSLKRQWALRQEKKGLNELDCVFATQPQVRRVQRESKEKGGRGTLGMHVHM